MKKYLLLLIISNLGFSATIEIGPNGCTLQDAIRSANNDSSVGNCSSGSGADTIIAPDGWSITLTSRLPTINSDMTIRSQSSADLLYISGDNTSAIMKVTSADTDLTLKRVKLQDGSKSSALEGGGAAIEIDDANVTIHDSILESNRVRSAKGGAININNGQLTTNFTVFKYNTAIVPSSGGGPISYPSIGGAIYSNQSTLVFNSTEFSDNNAAYTIQYPDGGDTMFVDGGALTITDSLINGTIGGIAGTAVTTTIVNTTFSRGYESYRNYAKLYLYNNSSLTMNHVTMDVVMSLHDTITVVTNSAFNHYLINYDSCIFDNSPLIVHSHNFSKNSECPGSDDFVYSTLYLQALTDNGGYTRTMKIGSLNSPLIDAGDPAYCLPTDQRGELRIGDCDVGAYELNDNADIKVELQINQNAPFVSSQDINADITVTNMGPGLANAIEVDYSANQFFVQSVNSALCQQLPCTLNQIASGQQVIIPVVATLGNYIQSPFNITVSAHSTGASTHDDPDEYLAGQNNEFSYSDAINPGADLSVDMNLIPSAPYFVNQVITYEAVITNHGQQNATHIDFEFTSNGMNLMQFNNCDSVSQNHCFINQINNQGNRTIQIQAKVTQSSFDAEALISADQYDIDESNNTDNQGNQGSVDNTDVSVSMSVNETGPYYANQYISFDIIVKADGKPASNVKLWSYFTGAYYIDNDICNGINPCDIGSMSANETVTLTFSMFAPVPPNDGQNHNWEHRVYVEPGQTDSDPSNNEYILSDNLLPVADMFTSVELLTDPPYYEGQEVSYKIEAINAGLNQANQVIFTPNMSNLTLQWLSTDQCHKLACQLSQMDLFQTETILVNFTIDDPGAFNFGNKIQAFEHDSNLANNNDQNNGGIAEEAYVGEIVFVNGFE